MEFSREIRRGVGAPRKHFIPRKASEPRTLRSVDDVVRSQRGEEIFRFRKSMRMSRESLAGFMSVHVDSIVNWEFSQNEPKNLAWASFLRVRENYRRKMKRLGKDLDGGPVMGDKS
jgi:DNA-binding transcriptional regulator YiaG